MQPLRSIAATLAALVLLSAVPAEAQLAPLDNRAAAVLGADRLLAIQNPDGSFPWIVGTPGVFQNVQGITAMGLLEAFKVSADPDYLAAAKGTRDWLENYRNAGPPPRYLSAPNIFFLAQYALLSGNPADANLARAALDDQVARYGSPEGVVTSIISARAAQGHTNLGLWDAAFFVRAAQDVGATDVADRMAVTLATQTIVDAFDSGANWYEIGLTGLLLGLSEADLVNHRQLINQAAAALTATQATDGSFPVTFGGVVYGQDTQTTAYAVLALASVGEVQAALRGSDFVRSQQAANGAFAPAPGDPTEYGELDSEAVMALVAGTVLVPNGALAYVDACSLVAVGALGVSVTCRVSI